MKNIILLLGVTIFALSCSKDELISPKQVNSGLVKEALAIPDNRSAIVTFQMLNAEEKVLFCRSRLEGLLKTRKFSAEQVKHINELIKFAKPELYESKTPIIRERIKSFTKRWVTEGQKYFTFQQLFFIGFRFDQCESAFSDEIVPPPPQNDCSCCSDCLSQCFFGSVGTCSTKVACKKTDSGCGIIGTSGCDGECSNSTPDGTQG